MHEDTPAFIADHGLFQALEQRSQSVVCKENSVLFSEGEIAGGVYLILSGEAVLSMRSESGDTVMRLRAKAGSLLGLPGVIGNQPYSLTAMVRRGSEVSFVPRNDLEALMKAEPSLCMAVLQVLAAEVRAARHALVEAQGVADTRKRPKPRR
jgi:CRP-like cAMP-binding protein